MQAGKVHRHFFRYLILHHIQLDELWANVHQGSQETWVWAVIEATSKLVPVVKLGPRTMDLAYAVFHDLCQMLQPGCVPIFTSDGLKLYFYALTALLAIGSNRTTARNRCERLPLLSCMPS
jgi:IS1 family transposase